MKKSTSHIWMTILGVAAVGGVGLWAYEKYYAATTLAPGAITVKTPSNGTAAFCLPHGARAWTSATTTSAVGATPVSQTTPSSPSSHLMVPAVAGGGAAITWVDSTGATQVSLIAFT